jgi:hypothetical protein
MLRRALFGALAVQALVPVATALAQAEPPPAQASPPRRRSHAMRWDEIPARKRRKIQQQLAGEGNAPLPPEEARRRWDGMSPQERRQATRRSQDRTRQAERQRPPREPRRGGDPMPPPGGAVTQ